MFQDEARFGRISHCRRCWRKKPMRPWLKAMLTHEYTYAYGAVSPLDGKFDSLVLPQVNGKHAVIPYGPLPAVMVIAQMLARCQRWGSNSCTRPVNKRLRATAAAMQSPGLSFLGLAWPLRHCATRRSGPGAAGNLQHAPSVPGIPPARASGAKSYRGRNPNGRDCTDAAVTALAAVRAKALAGGRTPRRSWAGVCRPFLRS